MTDDEVFLLQVHPNLGDTIFDFDAIVDDPHISADGDVQAISPEADYVNTLHTLPNKPRIYRKPNRKGETDKSVWGRCCKCENCGAITSWSKCKFCLRSRCGWYEYSEEDTTLDGEDGGETWTISASFTKMKELSGEIGLEVEALVANRTLTSQQSVRIVRLSMH
ncbi:hypothetical protein FOPE_02693 [Fonsecaea pedrosoi]|nr:hypothetical protein FOPE_02693 [Fonsecaea pedrosoi]